MILKMLFVFEKPEVNCEIINLYKYKRRDQCFHQVLLVKHINFCLISFCGFEMHTAWNWFLNANENPSSNARPS